MRSFIVDARVAVKWFVPEVHDAAAQRLLTGVFDLWAPDLLFREFGNILWKRVRAAAMSEAEATAVLEGLGKLPLKIARSWPVTTLALPISCHTGRTVYDCQYVALAVRERAEMVTADAKLYNALKDGPLGPSLRWIEANP